MTKQDQIKALAELDGFKITKLKPYDYATCDHQYGNWENNVCKFVVPCYLTSCNAIVTLIQKQDWETKGLVLDIACGMVNGKKSGYGPRNIFNATPAQFCEALLRATGKWIE